MPSQSLVDAMICIDGLDHDFYMFTNEDTGAINVIYKRKEGNPLGSPSSCTWFIH